MSIEPSTTGAAITVGVIVPGALGGVAHATFIAMIPRAQPTNIAAEISFRFILHLVILPFWYACGEENRAARLWPSERRTNQETLRFIHGSVETTKRFLTPLFP